MAVTRVKDLVIPMDLPAKARGVLASSDTSCGNIMQVKVYIDTHGCKLNQADSQVIAKSFENAGYSVVSSSSLADVHVVNTCTVTRVADKKARQTLRRVSKRNPQALLVATGCYAQRDPGGLVRIDGLNLVVGNTGKNELVERVSEALEKKDGSTSPEKPSESVIRPVNRTRAMVKIQEGCNQICAYCIVPKVRGRERSVHPDDLVRRIGEHVAEGYKEVVLTGTQLGSYGFDIPGTSLKKLLERILIETSVLRLRVSSLQPQEITPDLLDLWANPRLCRHFHVPLQSGSVEVLRRMKRRYIPAQYERQVEQIRTMVPEVGITTDVIVGFPGESDHAFEETYQLCRRSGFSKIHVFPYSARPGTTAAHFSDQIEKQVKEERVEQLLDLSTEHGKQFRHGLVGSRQSVLWESRSMVAGTQIWSGFSSNYVRASTVSSSNLRNSISLTDLQHVDGEIVWGVVRGQAR